MKTWVDKEKCIGCSLCSALVPDVFELEEDGKAKAKVEKVPENLEKLVEQAKDMCPVFAIIVEKD